MQAAAEQAIPSNSNADEQQARYQRSIDSLSAVGSYSFSPKRKTHSDDSPEKRTKFDTDIITFGDTESSDTDNDVEDMTPWLP